MKSVSSFSLRGSSFGVQYLVRALSLMLLTSVMFGQTVKTLVNFNGANGASPEGGTWTQGRDGKLYGTTMGGGSLGGGTFLRFNPATQNITVYHSFGGSGDGAEPNGGVTLGSDNNFYGTTEVGGCCNPGGVLYKITVNGTYTILHIFTGGSDGGCPSGPPIEATDGNFYGATYGDCFNGGYIPSTIYKLTRDGVYSVLYTFNKATTGSGAGYLMQGSDGKLYVPATSKGPGCGKGGTIVKVALSGRLLATHPFFCSPAGNEPSIAALTQASDGNYYGTTLRRGSSGGDTLFQLTPAFGVTFLYSFGFPRIFGNPNGSLVEGTDGNLYGTTFEGPSGQGSTLYQWSLSTGYRQLYVFPSLDSHTSSGLMQHTSGLFYGVTINDGTHAGGTIFSLDMGLGPFVALVRPHGKVGSNAQILGQGLIGTTAVTFNGTPAATFNVVSDTYMTAVVPSGATTGKIVVTTPTGSLKSNRNFTVTP
jgi:uncharacterized repeat protein (TIGR03803 family)